MSKFILSLFLVLSATVQAQEVTISAHGFDFDDTILFTSSKIFIYREAQAGEETNPDFKTINGRKVIELAVSTRDFSEVGEEVGKSGNYKNYFFIDNDTEGSFRHFRSLPGRNLIEEILQEEFTPGPALSDFNSRMMSPELRSWSFIITARGQSPVDFHKALTNLKSRGVVKDVPPLENIYAVGTREWADKGIGIEQAKLMVMSQILDRLQEMAKSNPKLKAKFIFTDDDYQNIQRAEEGLRKNLARWPDVEIIIEYVGTRREGVAPYKLNLKCSSLLRAQ